MDVIGPIKVDTTWPAQSGKGFDVSCFTIDWEHRKVICPNGQVSQVWTENRNDKAVIPASTLALPKAVARPVQCVPIVHARQKAHAP